MQHEQMRRNKLMRSSTYPRLKHALIHFRTPSFFFLAILAPPASRSQPQSDTLQFARLYTTCEGMRRDDRAANCSTCLPTGNDPARATVDLFWEVMQSGNTARVKAALAAGADVNGSPELPCPPIMAATAKADVGMISFLIENNVDPDRPAGQDTPCPDTGYGIVTGERALHLAAKRGNLEIVSLLLRQGGADPNAVDTRGRTALMVACTFQQNYVALVWLLLKAGADPTLMEENGLMPMHLAAQNGLIDLVDMLHAGAPPAALNSCSAVGETPLAIACIKGNESMVSRLLSLGARQQTPFDKNMICPLAAATFLGFVGVVRILLREGMEVLGGVEALGPALYSAFRCRRPKILQLLLAAEREESLSTAADITLNETSLLHNGVAYCFPAAVSVVLAAGGDEARLDSKGRIPRDVTPRDVIGAEAGREGVLMVPEKELAIRRMLERGPAYRARSWAWPIEAAVARGCGDDGGGAVVSSPRRAVPKKPPVGVRIFRSKSDRNFRFMGLVGRYCQKS